jgi:putative phosphoesterase
MLQSLEAEVVIHCGDVGTAEVMALFAGWPSHFVYGNCDDRRQALAAATAARQTWHGAVGRLELAGRRIAFLHGDDSRTLQDLINSGGFDLVCYGHTHKAETHQVGSTRVLNPGAVYRANPRSVAIVDLATLQPTIVAF